jgi:predicted alpha/beta superfamily hydrolase
MNFTYRILLFLVPVTVLISGCSKDLDLKQSLNVTNPDTGFEYKIDILEKGSGDNPAVFFVTDASSLLPIIDAEWDEAKITGSAIFIGLGYPEGNPRTRDYTPTGDPEDSGMAAEFFNFISNELDSILQANALYEADARKGIIGHSLGGLAAAYAFYAQNDFFDDYMVLSPALFWDDYVFFEIENSLRESLRNAQADVFVAVGEKEDMGMGNSAKGLKQVLEEHYPNVTVGFNLAKGSHLESRNENIREGLKYILK